MGAGSGALPSAVHSLLGTRAAARARSKFNGSRFNGSTVQRFNGSGVHSAPVTLGDSPAGDPMLVVNPIALQIAGSAQGVQLSWPAGERGYLFNPILFP